MAEDVGSPTKGHPDPTLQHQEITQASMAFDGSTGGSCDSLPCIDYAPGQSEKPELCLQSGELEQPALSEQSSRCDHDKTTAAASPGTGDVTPLPVIAVPLLPVHNARSCDFGGGLCELLVIDAIQEYLLFQGMEETLGALRKELDLWSTQMTQTESGTGGQGITGRTLASSEPIVACGLVHFDAGRRDAFFEVWTALVPVAAQRSPAGHALELRLRTHFEVYETRRALSSASPKADGPGKALSADENPSQSNSVDVAVPNPKFEDLKAFLSADPMDLGETSQELAPLFALPFVPQPHTRPGLKFIFEDAWVQRLRADVHTFLIQHVTARHAPMLRHLAGSLVIVKGPAKAPPPASWHELVKLADFGLAVAAKVRNSEGEASLPSQACAEIAEEIVGARWRLAAVAAQPNVLPPMPLPVHQQAKAAGQPPPFASSPDRAWPCSRETSLRANSALSCEIAAQIAAGRDGLASPSKRLSSARNLDSRARSSTALLPVPPALDFNRIAAVIAGVSDKEQGELHSRNSAEETEGLNVPIHAVLRAILRRLALPDEPVRPRRTFLAAFACFGALHALAGRLPHFINGSERLVTELTLAVLAVCACEAAGRREIERAEVEKPGCLSALVLVLHREPMACQIHLHCLALLQRLSLRRRLQLQMIGFGAVDWVLRTLQHFSEPSSAWINSPSMHGSEPGGEPSALDFALEFASALLMNLTLRSAGRKKCGQLGAYDILIKFIEYPNPQVRTHVNGSLYSLLGDRAFCAGAIQRGAEGTLRAGMNRVPEGETRLRKQLEHLLAQLKNVENVTAEEESDTDDGAAEGDVDDGDNFLDEEELGGHYLLKSSAVSGGAARLGSAAAVRDSDAAREHASAEDTAAEAKEAEEALRHFRASPAVADAQQRRFHTFIACGRGGLWSPKGKRRSSLMRCDPLLTPSPMMPVWSPASPSKGLGSESLFRGASPPYPGFLNGSEMHVDAIMGNGSPVQWPAQAVLPQMARPPLAAMPVLEDTKGADGIASSLSAEAGASKASVAKAPAHPALPRAPRTDGKQQATSSHAGPANAAAKQPPQQRFAAAAAERQPPVARQPPARGRSDTNVGRGARRGGLGAATSAPPPGLPPLALPLPGQGQDPAAASARTHAVASERRNARARSNSVRAERGLSANHAEGSPRRADSKASAAREGPSLAEATAAAADAAVAAGTGQRSKPRAKNAAKQRSPSSGPGQGRQVPELPMIAHKRNL